MAIGNYFRWGWKQNWEKNLSRKNMKKCKMLEKRLWNFWNRGLPRFHRFFRRGISQRMPFRNSLQSSGLPESPKCRLTVGELRRFEEIRRFRASHQSHCFPFFCVFKVFPDIFQDVWIRFQWLKQILAWHCGHCLQSRIFRMPQNKTKRMRDTVKSCVSPPSLDVAPNSWRWGMRRTKRLQSSKIRFGQPFLK